MEIGKRIKEIREKKGLTQLELSEKLKISIHTISKYEQGQREPSLEIMGKIAAVLGIELFELMVDREEVIASWNEKYNTTRLSQESQLIGLIKLLYPNDSEFIMELFHRLGLMNTNE